MKTRLMLAICGVSIVSTLCIGAYFIVSTGAVAVTKSIPYASVAERNENSSLSLWERGTAQRWKGYLDAIAEQK